MNNENNLVICKGYECEKHIHDTLEGYCMICVGDIIREVKGIFSDIKHRKNTAVGIKLQEQVDEVKKRKSL